MKRYQHKFGRWQRQAKYANGQPDPDAKDKKVSEKRILDESRRSCEKLEKAYDDWHKAIRNFNEKYPAPDWHTKTDADSEISQAINERYKKTFAYKLYGKKSVATFSNLNGDGGNCYVYSNSLPDQVKAMAEKKQREILDDVRKERPELFKTSDDYIKKYKEWENHRENDSGEIEDALKKYKKAVDERVAELHKDPEALEYLNKSLDEKEDQWDKTKSIPSYTIDESIARYASDYGNSDDYMAIPEEYLDRVTKSDHPVRKKIVRHTVGMAWIDDYKDGSHNSKYDPRKETPEKILKGVTSDCRIVKPSKIGKDEAQASVDLGIKALRKIEGEDVNAKISRDERNWFCYEDQTIGKPLVADLIRRGYTSEQVSDLIKIAERETNRKSLYDMNLNEVEEYSVFELTEGFQLEEFAKACEEIQRTI
jgi:tetratricopeptide (TPR) repeat protein